ncbi:TetR family transcriptional regulator [Kitasatospora azatica]|uniref:TetR family transcriptional regulator n=1 Tax=Kitasatospora azatica TaxID=58347 RepID=UPI00068FC6DC|nr:TetR family transcriptional regulator [Kitasatospora azatica]
MTEAQRPADWRARKKAATRQTIQEQATRLFLEKGFDATTVEEIAAAAGVSHMTFFRYFRTEEEVAASDDYDPLIGGRSSASTPTRGCAT